MIKLGKLYRHKHCAWRPVTGFTHGNEEGSPVLKGESSWCTINGIWWNTPKYGWIIWEFRRHPE